MPGYNHEMVKALEMSLMSRIFANTIINQVFLRILYAWHKHRIAKFENI